MNKKVKEIMRLSFHNNFFVDRNSIESNYEYLDALVDYVLEKETLEDYESIANRIWILDERIKKIFVPNMEIFPRVYEKICFDTFDMENCKEMISVNDVKRIRRCSVDMIDYINKIIKSVLLLNWKYLNERQKTDITNCILNFFSQTYNIRLEHGKIYKVKNIQDNGLLDIALNELIFWLSEKMDFRFSHQTISALNLLVQYEKVEMYFQINQELAQRECKTSYMYYDDILYNIIKPIIPEYQDSDNDFVFGNMSNVQKNMSEAYIYLNDEFCEYIYNTFKEIITLREQNKKLRKHIEDMQELFDELRKKEMIFQHEIKQVHRDAQKDIERLETEKEAMQKELFSLREYIFRSRAKDEFENRDDKIQVQYNGGYNGVLVVGGHTTWQKR